MHKVGIYLIYASVVLRGLVQMAGEPWFGLSAVLLATYGLLLVLADTHLIPRSTFRFSPAQRLPVAPTRGGEPHQAAPWIACIYGFLQSGLVVGLLLLPPRLDFFGLLLVPLSLQAVLFFGGRAGFLWIGLFFLVMAGPMVGDEKGWVFGLTMTVLNTGYCLLFSGYARQMHRAETVRMHNQHLLGELQVAHRQLQDYALQMEGLAAERERNRLARELHDSVTQTVFSMNLTATSARLLLDREQHRAAGQLERLEELAAGAMVEIQALVSHLRPLPTVQGDVAAALRGLAAGRQARDGLQVTLAVDGECALPEAVAGGLYRIAQEALANVVKHSGTHEATVCLHLAPGASFLEIEDGGLGFDPQAAPGQRGHLGLAGMAEQAREIGWHLSVESQPGRGTRVRVQEHPHGGAL